MSRRSGRNSAKKVPEPEPEIEEDEEDEKDEDYVDEDDDEDEEFEDFGDDLEGLEVDEKGNVVIPDASEDINISALFISSDNRNHYLLRNSTLAAALSSTPATATAAAAASNANADVKHTPADTKTAATPTPTPAAATAAAAAAVPGSSSASSIPRERVSVGHVLDKTRLVLWLFADKSSLAGLSPAASPASLIGKAYEELVSKVTTDNSLPPFELVYSSLDAKVEDYQASCGLLPPKALVLDFSDERTSVAKQILRVKKLPVLCIFDTAGKLLTSSGLELLLDEGCMSYPWIVESKSLVQELSLLTENAFHTKPTVVVLAEGASAEEKKRIVEVMEATNKHIKSLKFAPLELPPLELSDDEDDGCGHDHKHGKPCGGGGRRGGGRGRAVAAAAARQQKEQRRRQAEQQRQREAEALREQNRQSMLWMAAWKTNGAATAVRATVGLPASANPAVVILDPTASVKFIMEGKSVDEKTITKFVTDYLDMKLKPVLSSGVRPPNDRDPQNPTSNLTYVVNHSFKELVLDESKIVFLYVSVPMALETQHIEAHMEAVATVLNQLYDEKKAPNPIRLAKINFLENELDDDIFPENPAEEPIIKSFLPGSKDDPIRYDEDAITARFFLSHLHTLSKKAFNLDAAYEKLAALRSEQLKAEEKEFKKLYNILNALHEPIDIKKVLHVIEQFGFPKKEQKKWQQRFAKNLKVTDRNVDEKQWIGIWNEFCPANDIDPSHIASITQMTLVAPAMAENGMCSYAITKDRAILQDAFCCKTCNASESVVVCAACAFKCHKGHELEESEHGDNECFCDCGAGAMPTPCCCMYSFGTDGRPVPLNPTTPAAASPAPASSSSSASDKKKVNGSGLADVVSK